MLKTALAQMKILPGHPEANTAAMLKMIAAAKEAQAGLIIFPEMAIPGYLLGDTWEQESFLQECEDCGKIIIAASQDICIMFGNIAMDWTKHNNDGRIRKYNAFFTAQNGRLIQPPQMPYPFVIKTLLPNYREFDDTRHFFSLQKLSRELDISLAELIAPLQISHAGKTYHVGCLLCEDGWSDDYEITPLDILAQYDKLDFLVNISSSPYTLGKNKKRHRVFGHEAQRLSAPIFYVNNIGLQNNGKTIYTFDGSSTVYNRKGEIILAQNAYQESLACLDLESIPALPPVTSDSKSDIAHIYEALSYGVKEFLRSINVSKVTIGISGGIDSAVAAALYTSILGPKSILLINMPSIYNSQTTKGLAHKLASNLGCQYMIIPIQESVEHTIEQLKTIPLENALPMQQHLSVSSFVAENIQARDRSSRVLAGAAAAFGSVFTCNANKAEMTVGYSTLYGDLSGFLAVLADLWKYQIYDLAYYLNEEIFHYAAIPQETIDIIPSAELSAAQCIDKGQGDPLIYPYHDFLFRSFVERWNKATPEDILRWYDAGCLERELGCPDGLVQKLFPDTESFICDLERWWKLFTGIAIAKRIQAPPVLAVSRRAYGFDHRESQNGTHYTARYKELKSSLLSCQSPELYARSNKAAVPDKR